MVADGNGALAGGTAAAFGPEQQQAGEAGGKLDPREELELARKREAAEAVFSALWKAQEAAQAAAEASGEGSAALNMQHPNEEHGAGAWDIDQTQHCTPEQLSARTGLFIANTLQARKCRITLLKGVRSLGDPAGELETALKRAESFGRDSSSTGSGQEEAPAARAAAGAVSWANSEFAQEEQKGTGTMKIFRGGAKGGVPANPRTS